MYLLSNVNLRVGFFIEHCKLELPGADTPETIGADDTRHAVI